MFYRQLYNNSNKLAVQEERRPLFPFNSPSPLKERGTQGVRSQSAASLLFWGEKYPVAGKSSLPEEVLFPGVGERRQYAHSLDSGKPNVWNLRDGEYSLLLSGD